MMVYFLFFFTFSRASVNKATLTENFSKVGEGAILMKENQATYRLNATGRTHCVGLLGYLDVSVDLLSFIYIYIYLKVLPLSTERHGPHTLRGTALLFGCKCPYIYI